MKEMPECPVCEARLVYPDKPKRRTVRWRSTTHSVLVGVECAKCPAECDVDEELMFVRSFKPNRQMKMKVVHP